MGYTLQTLLYPAATGMMRKGSGNVAWALHRGTLGVLTAPSLPFKAALLSNLASKGMIVTTATK
jgi:hypothetical protein